MLIPGTKRACGKKEGGIEGGFGELSKSCQSVCVGQKRRNLPENSPLSHKLKDTNVGKISII